MGNWTSPTISYCICVYTKEIILGPMYHNTNGNMELQVNCRKQVYKFGVTCNDLLIVSVPPSPSPTCKFYFGKVCTELPALYNDILDQSSSTTRAIIDGDGYIIIIPQHIPYLCHRK